MKTSFVLSVILCLLLLGCSSSRDFTDVPFPPRFIERCSMLGKATHEVLTDEKIDKKDFSYIDFSNAALVKFLQQVNLKKCLSSSKPGSSIGVFSIVDTNHIVINNILFQVFELDSDSYRLVFYQIENWGDSDEVVYSPWTADIHKSYFHQIGGE